jgi:hypothetical protein
MANLWPHVAKQKEASMYSAPPPTPRKPFLLRWVMQIFLALVGFAAGRGAYAGLRALGLSSNAVIGVLALILLTIGLVVWLYQRRRSPR